MVNKKTLLYALIAFILSFGLTYVLIRNYKKEKNQKKIEKVQIKELTPEVK